MRVALYGPYGWGNLGDASIQEAALEGIRRRTKNAEFLGVSLNPENTEEIHKIASVPIRSTSAAPPSAHLFPRRFGRIRTLLRDLVREFGFLADTRSALRRVDRFIVSGGGQISDDWGGPWDHPYSLLKWVFCARLAGARVDMVSVGAGPIRRRLSREFFRLALRLAHYRSFRDIESREYLDGFEFTRHDPVVPDLAFSLPVSDDLTPPRRRRSGGIVVGIAPMSYYHPMPGTWPGHDKVRYDRYRNELVRFIDGLIKDGYSVELLYSQVRSDRHACEDIRREIGTNARLRAVPTESLQQFIEQILRTDLLIASRLHGVILAYRLLRPVIALSYQTKIDAVMRQFGQSEYCVDIDQATAGVLRQRLDSLVANLDGVEQRIESIAANHRASLDEQFDQLFGPQVVDGIFSG
jgi:polysaccharide pyruvyl transferase WcaK-like protein